MMRQTIGVSFSIPNQKHRAIMLERTRDLKIATARTKARPVAQTGRDFKIAGPFALPRIWYSSCQKVKF